MRFLLATSFGVSLVAAAYCACSSDPPVSDAGTEAGSDVALDTNVGLPAACVKSKAAAPFPSGTCNSPKPSAADSFDEALTKVGLDRCSVFQDPAKMINAVMNVNDKRALPDFVPLLSYPLRLPAYGADVAAHFDDAVLGGNPVSASLAEASLRRGAPLTECPDPNWFVIAKEDEAPLVTALGELASSYGADFDPDATKQTVAPLTLDLQRALAPIVRALSYAYGAIAEARAPALGFIPRFKLAPSWIIGTYSYVWDAGFQNAVDTVDVKKLSQAATFVATVIESVQLSKFRDTKFPAVEIDTAIGSLVIHGGDKDDYQPGSKAENGLFVLDTGGDDVYRTSIAATTIDKPLSIAVDLGGKDLYAYVEKKVAEDDVGHRLPSDGAGRSFGTTSSRVLRQGSALLGVGMLFDLGSDDDVYQSLAVSQGVGVFGVGVLYDEGGNDQYKSEALSQGASGWGIGLLLDRAGADKYLAYNTSEGYAFAQGVGAVIDESGDDDYYTDPGDPQLGGDAIYGNAQLPGIGNTSMSQGAASGHRPDVPEPGKEFPGGLGLLRDAKGNDKYTTSVFGQASAFALGIGMLLDGAGDDTYFGLWYVQGANAHTAVSLFHDRSGNDKYNPDVIIGDASAPFPIRATSIGVGHDYGSAVHYDEDGDDFYHGPGLSMGCGNTNGVGIMVVSGGNDTFKSDSINSLGAANSTEVFGGSRKYIQTLGVFVKATGTGTYSVAGVDASTYPNGQWSYAPNNSDGGPDGGPVYEAEKSIGIDRPAGKAILP